MKSRIGKITLAAATGGLFLMLYPFKVTVAPEWNVKVVDENNNPISAVDITEFASFPRMRFEHKESICSGRDGEAHFARHTVRMNVLTQVSKFISGFSIHGGDGPYVAVGVERLGYGDFPTQEPVPNFNGLAWYGSPGRLYSRVTLRKCPSGFTGYKCGADYAYYFSINGEEARAVAECASER